MMTIREKRLGPWSGETSHAGTTLVRFQVMPALRALLDSIRMNSWCFSARVIVSENWFCRDKWSSSRELATEEQLATGVGRSEVRFHGDDLVNC